MGFQFGIDFGTTNSACVGILKSRSSTKSIRYIDGYLDDPFPSIIIIDKITGEVYCGREAWERRLELGESCHVFTSIKSYLATDQRWKIAGAVWTPEKVAAEIFKGLKRKVAQSSGEDVILDEAVVAVPVGFPPEKRRALRRAAKMAGVNIKSFVSESTAAVFHNYEQVKPFSKIAVFDWGGGTLDISILENKNGKIKELAVGNKFLGGDNIDDILARWVHNNQQKKSGIDISFEEMPASARDKLISKCEAVKKELSYSDSVSIRLNKYGQLGTVNMSIDIDTFADLISQPVESAIQCMEDTLKNAELSFESLGCVLLVGGSVNLQPFAERIEAEWNCHKIYPENSEWSVAHGAALLSEQEGKYHMAESVGLVMSDGGFYPLIQEGTPIYGEPLRASFALVEDTDTANLIFASDHGKTVLGYLHVPTHGFFREQIDVAVRVDEDMVLRFGTKSKSRSDKFQKVWSYPGPKLYYELPVKQEVKASVD